MAGSRHLRRAALTNLLAANIRFAAFRLFLPFWFTFLNFDG
jgi:hypothetical protein